MGTVNDRSSQTPLVTFYADDNAVWGGCRYDGDGAFYSGRGWRRRGMNQEANALEQSESSDGQRRGRAARYERKAAKRERERQGGCKM